MSAQNCGCDLEAFPRPHICERHTETYLTVVELSPRILTELSYYIYVLNEKWWTDLRTGERINRNVGELLMLVVSELSEAMEGHRKGLMDDKLPHRSMLEVELADALIRIFDMCGGLKLDVGGAFVEKLAYNRTREDHSVAGRLAPSGKRY